MNHEMKIFTQTCKYSENLSGVTTIVFANKFSFSLFYFCLSYTSHMNQRKIPQPNKNEVYDSFVRVMSV